MGSLGFIATVTAGFCLWIVLWALGSKGFDAFLLTVAILVVASTVKILTRYLPGRRS